MAPSPAAPAQIAARGAFRDAMGKCGARLLEPVMKVEVITPEDHMGDVIGGWPVLLCTQPREHVGLGGGAGPDSPVAAIWCRRPACMRARIALDWAPITRPPLPPLPFPAGDLNSRRGMVNKFEDKPGSMKLVQVGAAALNEPPCAKGLSAPRHKL